jgi:hypothetical protein
MVAALALSACGEGTTIDASLDPALDAAERPDLDAAGLDAAGLDASGFDASGLDASGLDAPAPDTRTEDAFVPVDAPPDASCAAAGTPCVVDCEEGVWTCADGNARRVHAERATRERGHRVSRLAW